MPTRLKVAAGLRGELGFWLWVGVKLWSPLRGDLVWILGFLAVWGWCGFHAGPRRAVLVWSGSREGWGFLSDAAPGGGVVRGFGVACGAWLVLVFVGGGGAWPGFEIDRSEPSGSRVASERAGHRPRTYTRTQKGTTVNWRDDFGNRG